MDNNVINCICHDGRIRVVACDITELLKEVVANGNILATSACALGRCLSVAVVLGAMLKDSDDQLEIRVKGDGPIGLIKCHVDGKLNVRGFVENPDVVLINEMTNKMDVGKGVGKGFLEVVRKLANGQHFTSTLDLVSGEIGDDFANYFVQSEQIPSAVIVGVLVDKDHSVISAGGILIQMLPGYNELDVSSSEDALAHLKPLSSLLAEGMKIEEIVKAIYNDLEILNNRNIKFYCDCCYASMLSMLNKLPLDTLQELNDGNSVDVACYYCNQKYSIKTEDICELINQRCKN